MVIGVLLALPAHANTADPLIEGAKQCTRHFAQYERENGIPTYLLAAVASTESGRYHKGLGIKVPWPWTINANGKGYFFDSKQEAVAAARKLRARGIKSMDVGCMQVNLHHHPDAFVSLEQAFDPKANVAYASRFLRALYDEGSSWRKASASYHSRTPKYGAAYVGRVYSNWHEIIDKLRAARLKVPESSVAALKQMKQEAQGLQVAKASPKKTARKERQLAAHQTPRIRSVQVAEAPQRDRIIVVSQPAGAPLDDLKPAAGPSSTPLTLAQAQPHLPVSQPGVIHLDGTRVLSTPQRSGPNFIFND